MSTYEADVSSARLVRRLGASTKPRFISATHDCLKKAALQALGFTGPWKPSIRPCVCGLDGLTFHVGSDATQTLLRYESGLF